MKHNPLNLKPSDKVRLDEGFANSSIVIIKSITPLGMIATVESDEGEVWQVLTSRLSKLKEK